MLICLMLLSGKQIKKGDRHSFVGRLLCHNGVGPCGEVSSYSLRVHGLSMKLTTIHSEAMPG